MEEKGDKRQGNRKPKNEEDKRDIKGSNDIYTNWKSAMQSLFNSEVHQNLKSIHRILQKEFDSQDIF